MLSYAVLAADFPAFYVGRDFHEVSCGANAAGVQMEHVEVAEPIHIDPTAQADKELVTRQSNAPCSTDIIQIMFVSQVHGIHVLGHGGKSPLPIGRL